MMASVGPVTSLTAAGLLLFGGAFWCQQPGSVTPAEERAEAAAPAGRPPLPRRLPGNAQWTPLRAASLRRGLQRPSPIAPSGVVAPVELPAAEVKDAAASQGEPRDSRSECVDSGAATREQADAAAQGEACDNQSEREAREEPPDNRSEKAAAGISLRELAVVREPFPKALGTSHDASTESLAPGISQVNQLTEQFVDMITPSSPDATSQTWQSWAEEAGARVLERSREAAADALAGADAAARKFGAMAGVDPGKMMPHSGAVMLTAFLLDLLLVLPLCGCLWGRCRRRSRARAAEAEQAESDGAASEKHPETEASAKEAVPKEEPKGAAPRADELLMVLPSPMRTRSGTRPAAGFGVPSAEGELAGPGAAASGSEEALPGTPDEPPKLSEGAGEERALAVASLATPGEPPVPEVPEAPEPLELPEEAAEELALAEALPATPSEPPMPEAPESLELPEEQALAEEPDVTPTASVVRRGADDLAEVMRRRREVCEAWESAPGTCNADITSDKAYAVQAAPPAPRAELLASSPPVRRGKGDLMDLMRQRREVCKEFESAPGTCNADILTRSSQEAAASQRETKSDVLSSSPVLRRSNNDFAEVMRQRRESCHEFQQPPRLLRQSPESKTATSASPVLLRSGLASKGTDRLPATPKLPGGSAASGKSDATAVASLASALAEVAEEGERSAPAGSATRAPADVPADASAEPKLPGGTAASGKTEATAVASLAGALAEVAEEGEGSAPADGAARAPAGAPADAPAASGTRARARALLSRHLDAPERLRRRLVRRLDEEVLERCPVERDYRHCARGIAANLRRNTMLAAGYTAGRVPPQWIVVCDVEALAPRLRQLQRRVFRKECLKEVAEGEEVAGLRQRAWIAARGTDLAPPPPHEDPFGDGGRPGKADRTGPDGGL